MHAAESPLISIVIPSRNEAEDIAPTLMACLAMDYEPKEIIVVDDSTDDTPEIVSQFADRGVRLIHRTVNSNGCCGARNLGMQMARGEIIVLMNADNRPQADFLRRVLVHYQRGTDYVVVQSQVVLHNNPWSKFAFAAGTLARRGVDPEWSEGFSCRRSAAEAVGYIPGDFYFPFCRDYMLGLALGRAGYVKQVDTSILMEHVVPGTLSSYWRNRQWRGTFSAPHQYYFRGRPLAVIGIRELLKAIRTALMYLFAIPVVWRTARIMEFAPNGWRDIPDLFLAGLVQDLALVVGGFRGLIGLLQLESGSELTDLAQGKG